MPTKLRIPAKIRYSNYNILDYYSLDHIPIIYLIWKKQHSKKKFLM